MLCCPMTCHGVSEYKKCCSLRTLGSSQTTWFSPCCNVDAPFNNWTKCEMSPLWRAYTSVGGHLRGTNQGETNVGTTIFKQEQNTVLSRLREDCVGVLGLMFD